jgi:hypothetical protein
VLSGCLERVTGYFETSFLPGRRHAERDDVAPRLGNRSRRGPTCRPIPCRPPKGIDEDLAAMITLPPVDADVAAPIGGSAPPITPPPTAGVIPSAGVR